MTGVEIFTNILTDAGTVIMLFVQLVFLVIMVGPIFFLIYIGFKTYRDEKNNAAQGGEAAKDNSSDANYAMLKVVGKWLFYWVLAYGVLGMVLYREDTVYDGFQVFYVGYFESIRDAININNKSEEDLFPSEVT